MKMSYSTCSQVLKESRRTCRLPLRELAVISCHFIHQCRVLALCSSHLLAPKMRRITIITVDVSSIFVNVTHKVSKPSPIVLIL